MKILICSDIYPGMSGIANYCKELSKNLSKKNNISVLTGLFNKQKRNEIVEGIPVQRIKREEIEDYFKNNSKNFDKILVGWFEYLPSAIKNSDNVIYIAPSIRKTSIELMGKDPNSNKSRKIIKKEVQGMKKSKLTIYPSKAVKNQAKRNYKINKGMIIPPPVNTYKFKPLKNKKPIDVLTVANLDDKRKGIDKLINVAEKSNVKFSIVGDGRLRSDYEKTIKQRNIKNIKFEGKRKSKQFYKKSKIYVLPSRYEAFGLVLLEAMASEIPCIAFKPDNVKIQTASNEIIKDKKTGFLVKDEKEMHNKIRYLLNNEKIRKKMGKSARKESEKYSWKEYYKKISKVIK